MKHIFRISITAVFFIFTTLTLYSHPHTFIDSEVECEFSRTGLEGFWISWTFDPMFTAQIIMDYDIDRNGSFSETEILDIEENAFSNLINYNYFTYITENKRTFRPDNVTGFSASISGDDVCYRFFIPYRSAISNNGNRVIIAIYDDTFFCDIAMKSANCLENSFPDFFRTKLSIGKNSDKIINYDNSFQSVTRDGAVYSGFVNPDELVVEFAKK